VDNRSESTSSCRNLAWHHQPCIECTVGSSDPACRKQLQFLEFSNRSS
jgi:hypothetical protein